MNVFVKPNNQSQTCLSYGVARKGRMKSNNHFCVYWPRSRLFPAEPTKQRVQNQVCLSFAESLWRKTNVRSQKEQKGLRPAMRHDKLFRLIDVT